jgi:hypothetical protein
MNRPKADNHPIAVFIARKIVEMREGGLEGKEFFRNVRVPAALKIEKR